MAEPDFLQFAERCRQLADDITGEDPDPFAVPALLEFVVAEAERHARLLAQIQAWAYSEAKGFADLDNDEAKAHVRRLLEQP